MTGSMVFYLVLLLHGLPFTHAHPYNEEADCKEAGAAFVKDVLAVDPESKASSFCVKTPQTLSGFPCTPKPAPEGAITTDQAPASPPDPKATPPFELKSQAPAPLPPFADPGAAPPTEQPGGTTPPTPKPLDHGPAWKFKEGPMEEPKQ